MCESYKLLKNFYSLLEEKKSVAKHNSETKPPLLDVAGENHKH